MGRMYTYVELDDLEVEEMLNKVRANVSLHDALTGAVNELRAEVGEEPLDLTDPDIEHTRQLIATYDQLAAGNQKRGSHILQ